MIFSREILLLGVIFFVQQLPIVADWGIDLPLIFTILFGLRREMPEAAGFGFVAGLIQDLLSVGGIGINAASKTLVGLAASFLKMHIYRERVTTQTFLIFCLATFHEVLAFFLMRINDVAPRVEDAFWICLRCVLMTTLVGLVVSFFLVRFRHRRYDPATA